MSLREEEEGAVAVIVTVALLALMGIAALAIDAGFGYVERSNAQNAADHAALSAAWAECTGKNTAQARLRGVDGAARNGYTAGVLVNKVSEGWEATIDSQSATTFARVWHRSFMDISVDAIAACDPGTTTEQGFALYAGGRVCAGDKPIEMSGSNRNYIEGNIHSEGEIHVSGSNNAFQGGDITYVDYDNNDPTKPFGSGSNNTFDPTPEKVGVRGEWPLWYDIADYRPGGPLDLEPSVTYFNFGSSDIKGSDLCSQGYCTTSTSNVLKPGIYYTTGHIIMDREGMSGNVTFVAGRNRDRKIEFNKQNFTAYHNDLLALNNWRESGTTGCSKEGIIIKDENTLNGTLFAPEVVIEIPGDDNVIHGSLVALKIKINGDDNEIIAGEGSVGSDPHVYLAR